MSGDNVRSREGGGRGLQGEREGMEKDGQIQGGGDRESQSTT